MGRRGRKRRGLRSEPADGWPLDAMLVGVAALRTTRELFWQAADYPTRAPRAWDLALWTGVTAQGSAEAMARLAAAGLVTELAPDRPGRAPGFRLVADHPLVPPLHRLFETERRAWRKDRVGHAERAATVRRSRLRPGPSVAPVPLPRAIPPR